MRRENKRRVETIEEDITSQMNDRVQRALQQSRIEWSECHAACSLCSARVAVMLSLESGVKISSVNTKIFNFYDVRISIRDK